jgi:DNA-binding transcriptional LysR family regulator
MIQNVLSFVAVAKAKSFSNAAKALRVSKAQLSRHIKQLEESLNIQLIYRTTRTFRLTESGEQLLSSCQDLDEIYQDAIDSLKKGFDTTQGVLRLTAPISFGSEILPALIHEFTQQYPHIKIVLSLSSTTEDLIDKKFDLAFRAAPALPDSSMRMCKMMELEMILCAAPHYLATQKIPKKLEDLQNFKCITSVNHQINTTKIYWPCYVNKKLINFSPNNVIEIDGLRAQIQLLLLGTGIGRIPQLFVQNELSEGKLIEVLPAIKQRSNYIYLLYPNKKNLPKKIAVFIEYARWFFDKYLE